MAPRFCMNRFSRFLRSLPRTTGQVPGPTRTCSSLAVSVSSWFEFAIGLFDTWALQMPYYPGVRLNSSFSVLYVERPAIVAFLIVRCVDYCLRRHSGFHLLLWVCRREDIAVSCFCWWPWTSPLECKLLFQKSMHSRQCVGACPHRLRWGSLAHCVIPEQFSHMVSHGALVWWDLTGSTGEDWLSLLSGGPEEGTVCRPLVLRFWCMCF